MNGWLPMGHVLIWLPWEWLNTRRVHQESCASRPLDKGEERTTSYPIGKRCPFLYACLGIKLGRYLFSFKAFDISSEFYFSHQRAPHLAWGLLPSLECPLFRGLGPVNNKKKKKKRKKGGIGVGNKKSSGLGSESRKSKLKIWINPNKLEWGW